MVQTAPKAYTYTEKVLEEENLPVNDHPFQAKYGKLFRENHVQPNLKICANTQQCCFAQAWDGYQLWKPDPKSSWSQLW